MQVNKELKYFILFVLLLFVFSFTACSTSKKQVSETTTETITATLGSSTTSTQEVAQTTSITSETSSKYPDFIELTLDGERNGSDIVFYGTTNLPDGVLIAYEVTLPETMSEENPFYEPGNLTVKDGKYSCKISNVPEGKGEAEIWVAFQTILGTDIKQPQGVIDKYGELGEKMKGDNVTVFKSEEGDFKRIELIINR